MDKSKELHTAIKELEERVNKLLRLDALLHEMEEAAALRESEECRNA